MAKGNNGPLNFLSAEGGVGGARAPVEEELALGGKGIPVVAASGQADWDTPAAVGSVEECVRSNWKKCEDQFGAANCNQWSTFTRVNTEGFRIHQDGCRYSARRAP